MCALYILRGHDDGSLKKESAGRDIVAFDRTLGKWLYEFGREWLLRTDHHFVEAENG